MLGMGGAPERVSRRQPAPRSGSVVAAAGPRVAASALTGAARVVVEVVVVAAMARVDAARTGVVDPACVVGCAHTRAARIVRMLGLVTRSRDVDAARRGGGGRAWWRLDARALGVVRVLALIAWAGDVDARIRGALLRRSGGGRGERGRSVRRPNGRHD